MYVSFCAARHHSRIKMPFPSPMILHITLPNIRLGRCYRHVLKTSAPGLERSGQPCQTAVRMSSTTCRGVAQALDSDVQITDRSVFGMLAKPLASSHSTCGKLNQRYLITSYEIRRDSESWYTETYFGWGRNHSRSARTQGTGSSWSMENWRHQKSSPLDLQGKKIPTVCGFFQSTVFHNCTQCK